MDKLVNNIPVLFFVSYCALDFIERRTKIKQHCYHYYDYFYYTHCVRMGFFNPLFIQLSQTFNDDTFVLVCMCVCVCVCLI